MSIFILKLIICVRDCALKGNKFVDLQDVSLNHRHGRNTQVILALVAIDEFHVHN